MLHLRSWALAALVSVGSLLAGCGGSDDVASESDLTTDVPSTAEIAFHPGEVQGRTDLLNAYWGARLAALANHEDQLTNDLRRAFPRLEEVQAWDADVSKVFYIRLPTVAFVVFRGTRFVASWQGAKEALTDFRANQQPMGDGFAHSGFTDVAREAWTHLAPNLDARHGRNAPFARVPVYFVGHSMGAAAAALTMSLAMNVEYGSEVRGVRIAGLYSYGMPRSMDPALAGWFGNQVAARGVLVRRFVYGWDAPSQLPPKNLVPGHGYLHVGRGGDEATFLSYISRSGKLFEGRFDAPQEITDTDAVVHDHDPATYVTALETLARQAGQLR